MSDSPTRETPDSRSFEERIFARFDAFDGRLTALEGKIDSRLRETRPIWEAMQADLEAIKGHLGGVENRLVGIEKEVKDIGRGMELLHKDFFKVRRDQEELRERVEKLEPQSPR